jgi:hypothetical protein
MNYSTNDSNKKLGSNFNAHLKAGRVVEEFHVNDKVIDFTVEKSAKAQPTVEKPKLKTEIKKSKFNWQINEWDENKF